MANKKQVQDRNTVVAMISDAYVGGHSIEWLDLLVHFTLNPEKNLIEVSTSLDKVRVKNQISEEVLKLRGSIQQQVFSAHTKNEAELLIQNYHASLTMMLGQAFVNLENFSFNGGAACEILDLLIHLFEELIALIESRFVMYLSMDEYVPKTYFRLAQKELSFRLKKLKSKISINSPQKVPFEIIVNKLNRFINTNEFEQTTSYKNILYKKKLIAEVEKIDLKIEEFESYTKLDKVLIYLNFNSVEYVNYLISFIKRKIFDLSTPEEKSKQLYLLYKSFNQLYKKPGAAYNQNFHSIEGVLNNWFNQELSYLENIRTLATAIPATGNSLSKTNQLQIKRQKILCMLSSDQIGLILRAADEERILIAPSMSQVFKTIVPSLSTPSRENLSYDGVRSKSYVAEERDKSLAIEALEKIINKIKDY